ncbi:MAG: S1 RNA-binding domain-containing protein, partial [Candidatus Methylomirabilis sp.]|nr:S1 RNA-binding domain-containing protein [Deltaproteobacteria bacterium]
MANNWVWLDEDEAEKAERAPAAGGESFAAIFEAGKRVFQADEVVTGRVIRMTPDSVIVDIGYKSEGAIPIEEFRHAPGAELPVKPGDEISVYIEELEDEDGAVLLSKERADQLKVWDAVSKAFENDETVDGRIVQRVKGGLSVDIGVSAFLPGSQVDLRPIRNLDKLLGQTFKFKILKLNKRRGNIVLSRRAILEKERESLKSDTLATLAEGQIREGVVKNNTDYGSFIDLGGIDGLLHIT